ncbi:MAG: hypothetical protein ABIJ09_07700 [Pseudomonadota bacterium]
MEISVHLRKGQGQVVQAFCPDLPGCSAIARDDRQALELLRQRVLDYFEHQDQEPLAAGTRRVTLEV